MTQSQIQVVLFKPNNFGEDTRAIADELLKVHTVVLNLEDTNKRCFAPCCLDFLSGVAYANGGKVKRVQLPQGVHDITPYTVRFDR